MSQLELLKNQDVSFLLAGSYTEASTVDENGEPGGIYTRRWTITDIGTVARELTVTVEVDPAGTHAQRPGHLQHKGQRGMRGGPPVMSRTGRLAVAGFSLVELLIVIAILSIVMATAVGSFDTISRFFTRENVKSETQKKTRFGLETMIQDIMLAGLNPRGVSGSGVQMATGTSIRVASDLNFDGDFSDPFENTTYALNGSRLEQTNHLGAETLVDNVSSLGFTYFDRRGIELPEPVNIADVRSVGLNISLTRLGRGARQGGYAHLPVHIRCRNL